MAVNSSSALIHSPSLCSPFALIHSIISDTSLVSETKSVKRQSYPKKNTEKLGPEHTWFISRWSQQVPNLRVLDSYCPPKIKGPEKGAAGGAEGRHCRPGTAC